MNADKPHSEPSTSELLKQAQEAIRLLREQRAKQMGEIPYSSQISSSSNTTGVSEPAITAADETLRPDMLSAGDVKQELAHLQASFHPPQLFSNTCLLRFDVRGSSQALMVELHGEGTVGRSDSATGYVPEIDLSPHGAYRLGLSRRHATLKREGDQLMVIDLASRNGTHINGKRLNAYQAYLLQDGDELQFANLVTRVSFIKRA